MLLVGLFLLVVILPNAFADELPICTSDRTACFEPTNCINTMWDCPDNSDIFSIVIESEPVCDPYDYGCGVSEPSRVSEDSLTLYRILTFDINNLEDVSHVSFIEIVVLSIFPSLVIGGSLAIIIYYKRRKK